LNFESRLSHEPPYPPGSTRLQDWRRTVLPVVVTVCLLVFGLANVASRATSADVEDGVLWVERAAGVVAAEVAVPSAAERAGVRPGDVLLAIDGQPVQGRADVFGVQQRARPGEQHVYTLLRLGSREVAQVQLAPLPNGAGLLYFLLATVGIFTLLVGAAVRARRPDDQATLHFFWLSVAFFGVLAFSFSGRLDKVDWAFYWADVVALLLLPPLFLHFALVFPERPHHPGYAALLSRWLPAVYLPAAVLGLTRVLALVRAAIDPDYFVRLVALLDRLSCSTCGATRPGRAASSPRPGAFGHGEAPVALDRLGNGARGPAVCDGLRRPVRLRCGPVHSDGPLRRAARVHPARLRVGHRALPPDGRRDHPEAPAGVHAEPWRPAWSSSCSSCAPRADRSSRAKRTSAGHRPCVRSSSSAGPLGEGRPAARHRSDLSIATDTTIAARWSSSRATSIPTWCSTAWPSGW
jgi:hypothetical protein